MNASKNTFSGNVSNSGFVFEALESRELMSVASHIKKPKPAPKPKTAPKPAPAPAPVVVTYNALTITTTGGILTVIGSTGNDNILIKQAGNVFTISNGTWQTTVSGTFS